MPTYVYECKSCARVFERWQSISEPPVTDCECGAAGTVKRVMQPVGIAFRGEGFHINDYSAKADAASTKTEKPEDAPIPPAKSEPAPASAPAASPAPAPAASE